MISKASILAELKRKRMPDFGSQSAMPKANRAEATKIAPSPKSAVNMSAQVTATSASEAM